MSAIGRRMLSADKDFLLKGIRPSEVLYSVGSRFIVAWSTSSSLAFKEKTNAKLSRAGFLGRPACIYLFRQRRRRRCAVTCSDVSRLRHRWAPATSDSPGQI